MPPTPSKPRWRTRLKREILTAAEVRSWDVGVEGCRVAIVIVGSGAVCQEVFAPIRRARERLRDGLGIGLRTIWADPLCPRFPKWMRNADVVLLQCNHFVPDAAGEAVFGQIRDSAPNATLIYFDGDDDAGVAWPFAVRHSDLYVKNQLYADRRWYLKRFVGKSNLTDYVASEHGVCFDSDRYHQSRELQTTDLHKLSLGWNLGCGDTIARFATKVDCRIPKTTDIVFRGNVPEGWLRPLRSIPEHITAKLARRCTLSMSDRRISWHNYVQEMCRARCCISPFGYGEVCFRDFEAVLAGAVLIKPDMSHLETQPDIYRPWETYAPVKWDWSDLPEVVDRVLGDPEAGCVLASRARTVLEEFLDQHTVAKVFMQLISGKDEGTQHHNP